MQVEVYLISLLVSGILSYATGLYVSKQEKKEIRVDSYLTGWCDAMDEVNEAVPYDSKEWTLKEYHKN